jgi:CHRD domain
VKHAQRAALAAPALGLAALVGLAGPAAAADGSAQATLRPVVLNGVEGNGTAMASVSGTTLTVQVAASGLLADAPHAAHIHFGADARHECPTEADNTEGDTLITSEGVPAYGTIVVSLTTQGDTSPASGLAVDRMPVGASFDYSRGDVQVSQDVADAIVAGESVVVVHGVDHDDSGAYDGDAMSDLDPSLPAEATDPALCGVLEASQMAMPSGGVETGSGSTAGIENAGLIGAGALALAGGTALAYRRRTATAGR